jgi:hypothetical protein
MTDTEEVKHWDDPKHIAEAEKLAKTWPIKLPVDTRGHHLYHHIESEEIYNRITRVLRFYSHTIEDMNVFFKDCQDKNEFELLDIEHQCYYCGKRNRGLKIDREGNVTLTQFTKVGYDIIDLEECEVPELKPVVVELDFPSGKMSTRYLNIKKKSTQKIGLSITALDVETILRQEQK